MNFIENLDELKPYLRDYVESITRHSKGKFFVCPLPGCESGTGANGTGAFSIQDDGLHWKCFSCGKGGDIIDLCEKVENLSKRDATRRIIDRYGSAAAQIGGKPTTPSPAEPANPPQNFTDDIARYAAALPGSPAESYLQGRGFTAETMRRFNLGYDARRGCVTIPYNPQGTYYGRRSINADAKQKHDNLKGVPMPVFNLSALYSADVVFVVESPLCAISIAQAGGTAVAISGTGGKNRLLAALKQKPTQATLVICLDNDDAGRKAADDLDGALAEIGVFHVGGTSVIMGDQTDPEAADYRKDPNEVLQKDGTAVLHDAVLETIEAAEQARQTSTLEAEQEREQRTGAGMVDAFLQAIQSRQFEPMPTGIPDIDGALCGGFMRQQLVILGAAPGVGKTALAQWIFEGMAQRGTFCVYVNLEMSREQLLARSISRMAARQGNKIRALEVMQGYRWTDEQRAAILAAAQEYKDSIAPRFIMNPDGISANLDEILAYMEKEARRAEQDEQPAPVCVIDYLQLIAGQPREDATAVIKRAVASFKAYAVRHDTLVFLIIAHNRQSNTSGAVSMESARDTSAIEYSADLQLALTFTDCLKRDGAASKNPDDLTKEERQRITMRIVKGRFGGSGTDVDLHFDGETMTYTQAAPTFREINDPTPFSKRNRI